MRTENYRRGLVPALLAFALVLSMLLIALPVSATSATAPSSPITVQQGKVFLLRGTITFDKADTGYFICGTVYWYHYGDPTENFSLENTPSVYWENGTPVENVRIDNHAITNGWQVSISDNGDGIARNGTFRIDIWLRAASGDGTRHRRDNHPIYFMNDQITLFEPSYIPKPAGPITVKVIGAGVTVSISPDNQSGWFGEDLSYTVTVTNTGDNDDNYDLTVRDTENWGPTLSKYRIENIQPGKDENVTLTVTIPSTAMPCTEDNIILTATSHWDNKVSENSSCTAHCVGKYGVDVSISLDNQSGLPGATLDYIVTVRNTGNVLDNFVLTVSDNLGWGPTLDDYLLVIPQGENWTTTLRVHIPENAVGCTNDNMTVTATSQADNTVEDNYSCIAHAKIVRGVDVSISPSYKENLPGENLIYTVTVKNTGDIADTYALENSDNVGWPLRLENKSLTIPPFENRTTKLTVTIRENATPCTNDNIRVVATSTENAGVSDNDSCIAHAAIVRRVDVSISPSYENGLPGQTLSYTVKVTNEGNVMDNYDLRPSDNAGWGPSLARNLLENVSPRENRAVTLTVTIPENAKPNTKDNITVTAISKADNAFRDNASCIAHSLAISRGVEVSISPDKKEGMPGVGLSYTIGVMNTGNIADNYDLTLIDSLGWSLSLADNSVENVAQRENRTTTLTVVIYENAQPNTDDNITVTATSHGNPGVSDSASCLARALTLRRVEITISPGYRNGLPGATLNYTIRVTNTGWGADNYMLVVSGTGGWVVSIDPDSLALEPGKSGEAALSVTVPPGVEGSSMIFYVWAISSVDSTIRANATCRAIALEIKEGGKLSIPWVQIIIVAALIAGSIFAAGYLTRRRGRGRRRGILRK